MYNTTSLAMIQLPRYRDPGKHLSTAEMFMREIWPGNIDTVIRESNFGNDNEWCEE